MNLQHDWRVTWSQAQLLDLCERLGNGESYGTIAKAIGRDRGAVAGKVVRLKQEALDPIRTSAMTSRLADDWSLEEIAINLGVSVETVAFSFAMIRKAMGWQAR